MLANVTKRRSLNIFSNLKLSEAYKYQQDIREIKIKAGEYLFEEGEDADTAYIVRSGKVRLVKEIYNLRAIAIKDTVVLCLPKIPFSQLTNNSKIKKYLTKISQNPQLQSRAILEKRTKKSLF